MIRDARARGLRVSGEVTPHHLVFTDERLAAGALYPAVESLNEISREVGLAVAREAVASRISMKLPSARSARAST